MSVEKLLAELIHESIIKEDAASTEVANIDDGLEVDEEKSVLADTEEEATSTGLISWQSVKVTPGSEAERNIQDVMKNGPGKDNDFGEKAVVSALVSLTSADWVQVGGSKDHDIFLGGSQETSVAGVTVQPGKYEAKKYASGRLARLGQAKSPEVAVTEPLSAVISLGQAYKKSIVSSYHDGDKGVSEAGIEVVGDKGMLHRTVLNIIEFFESPFSGKNPRFVNMMALNITGGAMTQFRDGSFEAGLQNISRMIRTVVMQSPDEQSREKRKKRRNDNLEDGGRGVVKVTSDEGTPGVESDDTSYEFDTMTWASDVSVKMKRRQRGSDPINSDEEADKDAQLRDLIDDLKDLWTAMDSSMAGISELKSETFWQTLAEKTQTLGENPVRGIFGVDKEGFRLYVFPDLETVEITQGGRLVLRPMQEGKTMGDSIENKLRMLIRETLLNEELTKTDKKEVERLIRKGIERDRAEQKKLIKKELEAEMKTALGTSFFGYKGTINQFVSDEIDKRFDKGRRDPHFAETVETICKEILKKFHRDMALKYPQMVDRIKIR